MKFKSLIVDADIIITAHKYNFWSSMISPYQICVSSIVINEARFYIDKYGNHIPINLNPAISKGTITLIEATAVEMAILEQGSSERCNQMIQNGEKEAIALLKTGRFPEHRFCTNDGAAVRVLSAHGMGLLGVSLEGVFDNINQKFKLPNPSYSRNAFNRYIQEGYLMKDSLIKK